METFTRLALWALWGLTTFSAVLTQERGWIVASLAANLMVGRSIGMRRAQDSYARSVAGQSAARDG